MDASRIDPQRAAEVLAALWGVEGELRALAGYEDENFCVRDAHGRATHVFRVSHPRVERAALRAQNDAMICAAKGLTRSEDHEQPAVPAPCLSERGRDLEAWPDDPRRACRLLRWVPGTLWADARPLPPSTHRDLGAFLGRLDRSLAIAEAAFVERSAPSDFEWELGRAPTVIERHLDELRDPGSRALVERVLSRAAAASWTLDELPRAFVHNDANDYNVLLGEADDTGHRRVNGVIDFGDAFKTLRAAELAIAAAYTLQREHDPLPRLFELVRGYVDEHPLTAIELEALPTLIELRLCTSVCLAARNARLEPDNAYLQISARPAWRLLEQLDVAGPEAISGVITAALSGASCPKGASTRSLRQRRARLLSPSLSLSYADPLHIVRGRGPYLFDARGRAFVDGVNNVCHVGHAHPRVVAAAAQQMAALNTNTRYLHDAVLRYAERLVATLPDPLEVCLFVCSGSEANDLALRMARTVTQRQGVYVIDHAYHGHTQALIDASPYKFDGRGGRGPGPHTEVLPMPDPLRDPWRPTGDLSDAKNADAWVEAHRRHMAERLAVGPAPALFMAESMLGCGGQIELPPGYLAALYAEARAAGALCLADEVQVGFGRVGSHMWAFETQAVVPDIVTLGKPIGNGHPMAAVVTTREVADAFANGMEYFNTFGGNPVSATVGLAVLDVIEDQRLQEHALYQGERLREALAKVAAAHCAVAQVRGRGLFLGVELVEADGLTPNPALASAVVEHARQLGVLLSVDGPAHNVLKIKPPLVVGEDEVDQIAAAIAAGLAAELATASAI